MYSVSATSALVLLWTDEAVYESGAAREFLQHLDLDVALAMSEELCRVWPSVVEEVTNRKVGVKRFCRDFLSRVPHAQVVFLGAGLDPKSLDVAIKYPDVRVFDVDMEQMSLKKEITKKVSGPQNIEFCTANIDDVQDLVGGLEKNGWDSKQVTLVVAEGISYYLSQQCLAQSLKTLCCPLGGLVLEYAVPGDQVLLAEKRVIYQDFFDLLQKCLQWPTAITRYRVEEVQALVSELGGEMVETMDQQQLEREWKGRNEIYTAPGEGAVYVSYARL